MSNTADLSSLLDDTGLDQGAVSVMQLTADTMGPAIQAAMGDVTLDDIDTAEVVLVTLLIDDSGSIRFAGNSQEVRDGHNLVIESLREAKEAASVLVCCRYLNGSVLYPYRPLDGVELLDSSNYDPRGGTPLYDETAVTLTAVAAKMAEFEAGGVAVRSVTAVISDGEDMHSFSCRAGDVKKMVDGLLRTESHIIVGMGIPDPAAPTDFHQVFEQMGIRPEWILVAGDPSMSPEERKRAVRRAWQVVSQSAVRASQAAGGASFSQVAMGGLGGFGA